MDIANEPGGIAVWLATLDSMRQEGRGAALTNMTTNGIVDYTGNERNLPATSNPPIPPLVPARKPVNGSLADDSEDDLDVDIAKAALETGTAAFDAEDWEESDALLQEALQVLQQLPARQRAFCDIFALQYRLAVCAYYTQEDLADAERALLSILQQQVNTNEHRQYSCHAAHLLSLLYIRTGQIDRAKLEAERALHGRRRLIGKHSDASLESTALMAHIYALLNNRPRVKVCLAMIPEERRDEMRELVEASLREPEQSESSPVLTRSLSEESDPAGRPSQSNPVESTESLPMRHRSCGPFLSVDTQSQDSTPRHSHQQSRSNGSESASLRSVTVTSLSSVEDISVSKSMERLRVYEPPSTKISTHRADSVSESKPTKPHFINRGLSRGEVLRNLRCVPSDQIEEAVCKGDQATLASLLKKRNRFLRSKVQKALHSKRVTALHLAALFGEVEMARSLLASNFDINEVPELSTTRLTPLKFAIGARQVDMVAFLVGKGAKPIEPDTWSTLAGQLMDRSWLTNTMSAAERDDQDNAPHRMMAILNIWLKHRWNVNAPYEASGQTLLHQAVAFESGAFRWDSNLRITMTQFLCENGADPLIRDAKGNTPYDMAVAVADQGLLLLLDQSVKKRDFGERSAGLLELSAVPVSPVELAGSTTFAKPPVLGHGWTYG